MELKDGTHLCKMHPDQKLSTDFKNKKKFFLRHGFTGIWHVGQSSLELKDTCLPLPVGAVGGLKACITVPRMSILFCNNSRVFYLQQDICQPPNTIFLSQ